MNSTPHKRKNTLQNTSSSPTPSSENNGVYSGNLPLFTSFQTSLFVYFCVDYPHLVPFYLSSLVVSPLFFTPKHPLLATKMPLFKVNFALFEPCFNGSKRFCLYHSCEYLYFSPRIQQHFALRLAPKRLAFSTKTPCV